MKSLLAILCLTAAGPLFAAAPDDAKLIASMKQIGPTCSGLGKKITAKDASAAADAKQLAAWMGDVQKYWKAKKAADGVTHSKTAVAEFKTISKQTAAGHWEEAGASFKKATATCGGCHKVHREKAEGGWTIK